MDTLKRKVEELREQENMFRNEGRRGLVNLCKIAAALGYKDQMYFGQIERNAVLGDFIEFLSDNPGAVEAIFEWIGDQRNDEWTENINALLVEEDEDEVDPDTEE